MLANEVRRNVGVQWSVRVAQLRNGVWATLGLLAAGLIWAALSGAAGAWDGSVYLLQILDTQRPFMPNDRWINLLVHWPVVLASNLTSNITVLQSILGLSYAAVPIIALAVTWWLVRDRDKTLFVWAVLGIGLALLPGIFNTVSEANLAIYLFWPVLAGLLVGLPNRQAPLIIALSVAVAISHPSAVVLLGFAAGLALLFGFRQRPERRKLWVWSAGWAGLAVAVLIATLTRGSSYEQEQLTLETVRWSFGVAVVGWPLVAIGSGVVAALAIAYAPWAASRQASAGRLWYALATGGVIVATLALLLWARDPDQWKWANKYTTWALATNLGCMALAGLERWWQRDKLLRTNVDWQARSKLMQLVAGGTALVLVVQSTAWLNVNQRLRDEIAASPWSCISATSQPWLANTPLNQFGTPALSLLSQGRAPTKVVLNGDGCGEQTFQNGLRLDQYALHPWNTGWFDLSTLSERVIGEQESPQRCSFALTTGWHQTETNGAYWWRWSDGQAAQMRVLVPQQLTVALNGQIEAVTQPNTIAVLVNGVPQTEIEITWDGLKEFGPLPLALEAGTNTVQFVSRNPALTTQGRPLALDVANLGMTSSNLGVPCVRHP